MNTKKMVLALALVASLALAGCATNTNDNYENDYDPPESSGSGGSSSGGSSSGMSQECKEEDRYLNDMGEMMGRASRTANDAAEDMEDYQNGYDSKEDTRRDMEEARRAYADIYSRWQNTPIPDERYRGMDDHFGNAWYYGEEGFMHMREYFTGYMEDSESRAANEDLETANYHTNEGRREMPDEPYCKQ